MPATLTDIRVALAAAVTDIPGLTNVYTTSPDQVNPPCAVVEEDDPFVIYAQPDGLGLDEWKLRVLFIASRVNVQDGQALLDSIFEPTVVKTTIQDFDWLGHCPSVSNAEVTRSGGRGVLRVGEVDYLAGRAYVTVLADSGVH